MLTHLVLAAALAIAPFVAASQTALSASDIEQAIEFGLSGEPEPYLLRHVPGAVKSSSVIVGVVYTPFVRVAVAARHAREEGQAFTPADVTPKLVEPVIYIALRWYCCDTTLPELFDAARPVAGAMRRQAPMNERRLVAPAWVTDDLSVLRSLYGNTPLPFDDLVLVAAFPTALFTGDFDFVVRKEVENPAGGTIRSVRRGRLVMEDVARWR